MDVTVYPGILLSLLNNLGRKHGDYSLFWIFLSWSSNLGRKYEGNSICWILLSLTSNLERKHGDYSVSCILVSLSSDLGTNHGVYSVSWMDYSSIQDTLFEEETGRLVYPGYFFYHWRDLGMRESEEGQSKCWNMWRLHFILSNKSDKVVSIEIDSPSANVNDSKGMWSLAIHTRLVWVGHGC